MKLTKAQAKAMTEVEQLVALDRKLTDDEREFILENFQEGAKHDNAAVGAFFTPLGLARDFAIEVPSDSHAIIDLCAGIGSLSYACGWKAERIVCVEQCAEYVRVGRKVMPDAIWIHADVFGAWMTQLPPELQTFDCAIANPPFGNRVKAHGFTGRYIGATFEYKVIELASRFAQFGAFIVPQMSAPFEYSGKQVYRERISAECQKFMAQTGIDLMANCGIDTAMDRNDWHGVAPTCEIVTCDFPGLVEQEEVPMSTALHNPRCVLVDQLDLFGQAA